MDTQTLNNFRKHLTSHRDSLLEWLDNNSPYKNINLGGAEVSDVLKIVNEIKNALERIDNNCFCHCKSCDTEIEKECLELDFTTQVCLECYSKDQLSALERDLELAAKVQRQLLPHGIPVLPGIQIATYLEPAQIVSGDYFDFYSCKDNTQGIVIADVMGKGLSASMLMSNLQASLRILGPEHKELHSLTERLNELFRYNLKLIRFITFFIARIDLKANILHYCNAGHNPAIWWESATETIHWLKPTGPAIGLTPNAKFSENRLVDFIEKNHSKSANDFSTGLLRSAKKFAQKFQDDVTMIVIKIL